MRLKWWPDDDGGSPITVFAVQVYSYEDTTYVEPDTCTGLTYLDDLCFVEI